MKKQELKILLLFSSLVFLGMIFDSCQIDDEHSNHKHHNIKVSEKRFNELIQTQNFKKAMEKIPKIKKRITDNFGRTVMEDQYGFSIIDAPIKTTETESVIAYNILIKSDTIKPGNYFENLVINIKKSTNELTANIIKYDLIDNIYPSADNSFVLNATRSITPVVYNMNTTSKESLCVEIQTLMCSNHGDGTLGSTHVAGDGCKNQDFLFWQTTYSSCGGGTSTTNGTSTTGTTGTTGGVGGTTGPTSGNTSNGGTNDTTTSGDIANDLWDNPVPPCETCPEINEDGSVNDPCDNLKNGTSSVEYKIKFKNLNKQEKFNAEQESGFSEQLIDPTTNTYGLVDLTPVGTSEIYVPSGSLNFTHVHNNKPSTDEDGNDYDKAVKILSPKDLLILIRNCQLSNTTNPTNAFVNMISDEGIFSITILEEIQYTAQLRTDLSSFLRKFERLSRRITTDPNGSVSGRKLGLQILFLEELKKMGLENKIGLFEGIVENENSSDINNYNIKWTRKKLKKGGFLSNPIEEIPCN